MNTLSEAIKILVSIFWNKRQSRLRTFWRLLIFTVVFAFFGVTLSMVLALLAKPVVMDALDGADPATSPIIMLIDSIFMLVTVLLSVIIVGKLIDRRRLADFGFHFSRRWWGDFGFGLALGALLMCAIFLVEYAAGWVRITGTFVHPQGLTFLAGLLSPLVIFFCVGIYEELLSRGYILHNIAEGLNFKPVYARTGILLAWLVSSILFGLAHAANPNASLISTLNLVVAGLFLGLGFILTGDLAIPIGLHMTWNFFQGNVFGFPVSGSEFSQTTFLGIMQGGPEAWTGGAFGPEAGLLGLLAMLAGSGLILLYVRLRKSSYGLHTPLACYKRESNVEQITQDHISYETAQE